VERRLLPPSHLEVRINVENDIFMAKCDAFPLCLGQGDTPDAALRKLGKSIALYIAKSTRVAFEHIFDGSQFTQVIVDAQPQTAEQVRMYSLSPLRGSVRPPMMVKIRTSDQVNAFAQQMPRSTGISVGIFKEELSLSTGETHPRSEGIFFGLPLNLN
jgi:predicted RNase H-like HicB family nuclease